MTRDRLRDRLHLGRHGHRGGEGGAGRRNARMPGLFRSPALVWPTLVLYYYTAAPSYQQDARAVRGPGPALMVLPCPRGWCPNPSDADAGLSRLGRASTYLPTLLVVY